MTRSQIHKDLFRRIHETHHRWHKDAGELYEIGGLWPCDLDADVLMVLLSAVVTMMARYKISVEEIATDMGRALAVIKKQQAAEKRRKR